jgi:DNA (cytosine-5)-methyltransferase 1
MGIEPVFPKPLPYRYSVRDALPWIVRGKYGAKWQSADSPSPTVSASLTYNPATSHQGLELVEAECDITKYAIGKEWDRLAAGQRGKYLNFIKPHLDRPCPTVTQTGGITGAASVVHPIERRKFSIAELRRICGFPDDFVLTGRYSQQWERLGRAVPPVMMFHIAHTIREEILCKQPK